MASFFIIGEKKTRPGVYLRYENWGKPPVAGVDDGKCAAVFRSNWGPLGQALVLEQYEDIAKKYGDGGENGTTAVPLEQFKGGARLVYALRLGTGGTHGSYTISDAAGEGVIRMTLKYPGSRKLAVTIRPTLADPNTSELLIVEGTEQLEKLTFSNAENSVDALMEVFGTRGSDYFMLTKVKNSTEKLASVDQAEIAGGTDPTVTVASYLMSLAKLNCMIRIYAHWGAGRQKMFEGNIWEWNYTSAQTKELTLTVYDPMIRLQQCKDIKYFSPGMTTPAMLGSICGDWGVPLAYRWSQQITHEKKVFNGEAVSDIITKLLEEVRQQTGGRYVALYKDGALTISDYGTNSDVYVFDTLNTISTSDKLSMSSLVTRVKIIGKEDNQGRMSVDAVVDGDMHFGILQEVIKRDNDKSIGTAMAEAQATLKERGKPEESIMVNGPDLPFLRKGDAVEVAAGNLIGRFHVLGVSHNATQRQMTMTLRRAG